MASNKIFRFGPVALTTTLTTILLSPPTATGGVNAGASPNYIVLRKIRVTNKTALAVPFSLWLGATAENVAGTEVVGTATVVPANGSYDWYGLMRIDADEYLVGGAGTTAALTIVGEGEIGIAG